MYIVYWEYKVLSILSFPYSRTTHTVHNTMHSVFKFTLTNRKKRLMNDEDDFAILELLWICISNPVENLILFNSNFKILILFIMEQIQDFK